MHLPHNNNFFNLSLLGSTHILEPGVDKSATVIPGWPGFLRLHKTLCRLLESFLMHDQHPVPAYHQMRIQGPQEGNSAATHGLGVKGQLRWLTPEKMPVYVHNYSSSLFTWITAWGTHELLTIFLQPSLQSTSVTQSRKEVSSHPAVQSSNMEIKLSSKNSVLPVCLTEMGKWNWWYLFYNT